MFPHPSTLLSQDSEVLCVHTDFSLDLLRRDVLGTLASCLLVCMLSFLPFTFSSVFTFILCVWLLCSHVYTHTTCMHGTCDVWKTVSYPLELELQMAESLCGCWELKPSPLEEQPALLAAEPPLQSLSLTFSPVLMAEAQPPFE